MISPSPRMRAETEGAIGWITFNNPKRRNAVSLDMWEALSAILAHFDRDDAVRVIVLKGEGERAFVSGADISQFEAQRATPESVAAYDRVAEGATRALAESRKPTIAMVRGWCIGGGVGIALCCDLRIASDDARFGVPAARLGLGYRWAGIKKLVDLVGPAHAKEIFLTARHFTAAEAHAMGLVNRVVAPDGLDALVRDYARIMAENAPLTMHAVKETIAELGKPAERFDRARCEALVAACFASEDYVEGRRAFMEKRLPAFRGR